LQLFFAEPAHLDAGDTRPLHSALPEPFHIGSPVSKNA
jgi:hypothetical protein